ncbi:E3 ubiquitin-protein ligase Midline-1-like [Rana temporaria]|uniref:E3 ubiquitin-protein ligase Midline-1-like n=1 Tax=Rana temporaria TaxID=8407 RepID=UPI001AACAA89|nr:E3 ubiquitin-protein ligase Midline-1-like [Rana temporaria]
MEISGLIDRLSCSICLNVFAVPVTLTCGHNFCRACIAQALGAQDASGVYSCPECRAEFPDCPALQANSNLQNIVEMFYSEQPESEGFAVLCTFCVDSPAPAVKTCLRCESSLCHDHLKAHSKSDQHILIDPAASLEDRKCSFHKKKLMLYCYDDEKLICVDCCPAEHEVELIDEASEKKKGKLRKLLDVLASKEEDIDGQIWNFQEKVREREEKVLDLADKATALFRNIRRQLEDLEKRVLTEVFRGGEEFSQHVSGLIKPLQVKKDELSRKRQHLEELCNMADPIGILQEQKLDFRTPEEWDKRFLNRGDIRSLGTGDLDEGLTLETIHLGLSDIVNNLSSKISILEASDIVLDVNTAAANIAVSPDRKMALLPQTDQYYPESPERFEDGQVISCKSFSSGRHFWEVETSELGDWMMGLAYPSIDRHGDHSWLGENARSWCLTRYRNQYSVIHDGEELLIPFQSLGRRFRVYLDYEGGRLSFYELGNQIRHLHTFSTVFTEPLHAAFGVLEDQEDCWLRIRS